MANRESVKRITETLRESGLAWLLSNLRQDSVVWNALNDPAFFDKVLLVQPEKPAEYSPANLALLALDQPDFKQSDQTHKLNSIDDQVIQLALQTVGERATLGAGAQDLATAGLVAISWFNKYSVSQTWEGLLQALTEHPLNNWKAHVTCLFGLLDHPAGLLHALVHPGSSSKQHELAIHAILSNPLTTEEQLDIIVDLCHGEFSAPLPVVDRLSLLQILTEQQPQLAVEFCRKWMEIHPELPTRVTHSEKLSDQLQQLLEDIFNIEIKKRGRSQADLPHLLDAELYDGQDIFIQLICHNLACRNDLKPVQTSLSNVSDMVDQAIRLGELSITKGSPLPSVAELAFTLAESGLADEASQLVFTEGASIPDDLNSLYAAAKFSLIHGDEDQCWQASSRILALLERNKSLDDLTVWGNGFSLENLGNLLLSIRKYAEAAQVLERALYICPNEAGLLKLQADCYQSAHQAQKAADTLNILVSLNPDELDYRRAYALSLEEIGEWQYSLEQRLWIIEAGRATSVSATAEDKYACAHCAIKANKPSLALDICQTIADQNPDDSQALIYIGEAFLLMDETERGMEHFTRATQVAPERADGWLALANAQKEIYPLKSVLATLKNASLAVPGAAEIHYALGDAYMQDSQPTLALPELQSAVELSPNEPAFLVRYADALLLLGHLEASREIFSRAYSQNPDFPGLALNYGKVLLELGKLEEAIAPFETLINSKTIHEPGPYLDYARCVLALNKQSSTINRSMNALIALNEVLQIDPQHAEAKALTAEALAAHGEFELAFQAYREALDTPLKDDKAWFERLSFGLGCVASSIGKQDIAIAALQDAAQANPDNPATYMTLSDACIAANLPEDALRSARAVLVIDEKNPDHLAWFAAQVAKLSGCKKSESFGTSSAVSKEVVSEALSALESAIRLAPTRADLLVRLGNFQATIGEQGDARVTFSSIANFDFATVDDLTDAAKYLSEIGDHLSAIACLEKGILSGKSTGQKPDPALYIILANEQVKNHDHASAIETLNRATEVMPAESSLISLKTEILLELGQVQEALQVIEQALQRNPSPANQIELYLRATQVNRTMGNFANCISYARMGAALVHKLDSATDNFQLGIAYRTIIAELYRALLQPDHALHILTVVHGSDKSNFSSEQDYLDFILLHTELALGIGERILPEIQEVKLEASHPNFARLMAINARLMNKAGNYKQAEQLFNLATYNLDSNEAEDARCVWSAPYTRYLNLEGIIEAAQELGLWDQAEAHAQQAAEIAGDEPLCQLNMARIVILRAEFDQLCGQYGVTRHRPHGDGQAVGAYELCSRYLEQAKSALSVYQGEAIFPTLDISEAHIQRWQARADIIFNFTSDHLSDPVELLTRQVDPGDTAAVISHLRKISLKDPEGDTLATTIKLARLFPRHPLIILQLALALRDNNPMDAMKSLQSVLEHNPYAKNPYIAFCNVQLGQTALAIGELEIAQQAMEKAISFWPDEPEWHSLAAEIYQRSNTIGPSIQHLKDAASLAPDNFDYHVKLGEVLFDNANEDVGILSQALDSFEKALAQDPNNITILAKLADTYYQIKDFRKAEAYARNALSLSTDRADLYQLLGKIALEKNDFQGAYEFANKAVSICSKDAMSLVLLAKALSAMGRYQEALAKLSAAIPLAQEGRSLQLERVNIIRKVNGLQVALTELKTLTNNYPDDFNILMALSKLFFEAGELDNAVTVAQKALNAGSERTSPNERANLHLLIGQAFHTRGDLEQSIQHLNEAIQLAPNRLEPYLELGLARKERREYQQALSIFEQATQIAPNDPRALFQAGLALKESKDYKSSETMLRRAINLAPNDLSIRRQLAAVVALNLIHNPRSARINA